MGNVEGTREMVERSLALEHDADRRAALQALLEKVLAPAQPKPGADEPGKPPGDKPGP
jgi:hypothetical protein